MLTFKIYLLPERIVLEGKTSNPDVFSAAMMQLEKKQGIKEIPSRGYPLLLGTAIGKWTAEQWRYFPFRE